MKIIRLAQVPSGFVKIEVRIKGNGTFERKIIREGKTTCKEGDEKRLLEDLLNIKVPGFFGTFGQVGEAGRTQEYWEQTKVKVPATPSTPEEEEEAPRQAPQRRMDQGYGV